MEFYIGDRVKVKEYVDIPEQYRTQAVARLCGNVGTVTDRLWSEGNNGYVYRVHLDGYARPSNKMWSQEHLDKYVEPSVEYKYEFDVADNVVVAILYEMTEDSKTEIARGHGHIIHEGALGIAQASSYALKKIYYKLNDGGDFS